MLFRVFDQMSLMGQYADECVGLWLGKLRMAAMPMTGHLTCGSFDDAMHGARLGCGAPHNSVVLQGTFLV